jgi:hypothetical protein
LEMAAARLLSMQPREMAARLDQRFRLLAGVPRVAHRHQTLRATVSWSYDLLSDRERQVFRRLAVFAGAFGLDAAEAVTSGNELDALDVDQLMDSLVRKSLVGVEPGLDSSTRYRLLETVRQFALEHLMASGEAAERCRRHGVHYAAVVAAAADGLRGADEPAWADHVAEELDNLRAAESWAVAQQDARLALALFAPMPPTSLAEPVSYEIFTWVDNALNTPGAATDPNFWPALNWRCLQSVNLLEFDALRDRLDEVRNIPGWEQRPEPHYGEATMALLAAGDLGDAALGFTQAADRYEVQGDAYHAVRHRAMSLLCRAGLGVDDGFRRDVRVHVEQARRLKSPFMRAFGIVSPAAAPSTIFDDPAASLAFIEEIQPDAARSRNPFAYRIAAGSRLLALALLGDETAILQAVDAIEATLNRNQAGGQLSALSVAFGVLGHHHVAAELIGGIVQPNGGYGLWANFPQVVESWTQTRVALGDDAYHAALARGASRGLNGLIPWLRSTVAALSSPG